ncbi:MAG: 30S ribosomal protein S2 [Promethearchaeota archaeon]
MSETTPEEPQEEELLIPLDQYLANGIHIGTQVKTKSMRPFIYRVRPDGLYVLDIKRTDERLRVAAKFLARYNPEEIVVISARQYGQRPAKQFCDLTRAVSMVGRFIPGSLTNPASKDYIEPGIIMVTDPRADSQAIKEAVKTRLPVVALCDTDSNATNIDLIIPTNNKGRKALSTVYWLLARQLLRERGEIPPDGDLSISIDDFQAHLKRT